MDISETYIKMCQGATEIQNLRDLDRDGDFFATDAQCFKSTFTNCHDEFEGADDGTLAEGIARDIDFGYKNYLVWLPRQDQLQEMVGDFDDYLSVIYWWQECGMILCKREDYWGYDQNSFTSIDQLLLACVMKRNYNKIWTGDKWHQD